MPAFKGATSQLTVSSSMRSWCTHRARRHSHPPVSQLHTLRKDRNHDTATLHQGVPKLTEGQAKALALKLESFWSELSPAEQTHVNLALSRMADDASDVSATLPWQSTVSSSPLLQFSCK